MAVFYVLTTPFHMFVIQLVMMEMLGIQAIVFALLVVFSELTIPFQTTLIPWAC
jgi:hypothetical protein